MDGRREWMHKLTSITSSLLVLNAQARRARSTVHPIQRSFGISYCVSRLCQYSNWPAFGVALSIFGFTFTLTLPMAQARPPTIMPWT